MMGNAQLPATALVALKSLGLTHEELDALAKQGTLTADAAGYYRLRYRMVGRRLTKYVGKSPEFVALVRQALDHLQQDTRIRRRRDQLTRRARECLQKTRRCWMPLASAMGYHFRGFELRRCNSNSSANSFGSSSQEVHSRRQIMDNPRKDAQQESIGTGPESAVVRPKSDPHGKRLQELYQSALELTDPRRRNARYAMAELMDVGSSLADVIKQEFRNQPRTLKDLRKNGLRAISSLAALHRSACRYAQFERQLEAADETDNTPALPAPDRGIGET